MDYKNKYIKYKNKYLDLKKTFKQLKLDTQLKVESNLSKVDLNDTNTTKIILNKSVDKFKLPYFRFNTPDRCIFYLY